ncbi:MAG: TonB-dependent receptor plug domain-containing protein [Pseudomonadota bacterium]
MLIRSHLILSSVSACALFSLGANAQSAAIETSPEEEADRRLSIVMVTSQKREQSLQDVPVVVTALTSDVIADAGVRDIKDVTILTPGLIVTSSASSNDTTARIRGVGTVGNNPGLESSVAINIDGVSRARNGVAFGDLGEIERIEVLKGPQGTLFGKSSSAGVINIITKGPEDEFSGQAEFTAGNLGLLRTSGSVTGALTDSARGRLFGVYAKRDGTFDSITVGSGPRTDQESDSYEFYSLRGQLEFDLNADATLKLIGDFTDREENCCLAEYIAQDPARSAVLNALAGGQGTGVDGDPFGRDAFANRDSMLEMQEYGLSAELDWALSFGDLTSITAYRDWQSSRNEDSDWSTADIWYRGDDGMEDRFQNFSQELRLNGQTDRVDWLVGAYFAVEEFERFEELRYGEDYFS